VERQVFGGDRFGGVAVFAVVIYSGETVVILLW